MPLHKAYLNLSLILFPIHLLTGVFHLIYFLCQWPHIEHRSGCSQLYDSFPVSFRTCKMKIAQFGYGMAD